MATEFEVGGKRYRVGKLDAFKQLHLARKIGPIITKIAPQFASMQPAETEATGPVPLPTAQSLGDVIKLVDPVIQALSDLKEDDVNYIARLCLSVVQREEGVNSWIAPWNAAAGRLQFQDIELPELVEICVNVIQENLGRFLSANPLTSGALTGAVPTST